MGKGSVKVKDKGYVAMMKRLRGAQPVIRVGVFGDKADAAHEDSTMTVGEIGEIHEFGRGNNPERSWLRGYVDENNGRISQMLARIATSVATGKLTAEQGLNLFGLQVVGEIKERLPHLLPVLSRATINRKGSSATLIDKGQFRSAIAHQVIPGAQMSEHGYDLEEMRAGLVVIFQKITGLSEVVGEEAQAVTEDDQPWVMPNQDKQARLSFKTVSIRSLGGGDEVRQEYDPDLEIDGDTSGPDDSPATGGFVVSVGGPRVWTLSVKVECWDLKKTAFEYAERARANLQRPSILDMIKALDCSLNDVRMSRDISYTEEQRVVSCAVFELVLNITSNLDDDPVTTIETVNVTAEPLSL